jgi:hypothetical protein
MGSSIAWTIGRELVVILLLTPSWPDETRESFKLQWLKLVWYIIVYQDRTCAPRHTGTQRTDQVAEAVTDMLSAGVNSIQGEDSAWVPLVWLDMLYELRRVSVSMQNCLLGGRCTGLPNKHDCLWHWGNGYQDSLTSPYTSTTGFSLSLGYREWVLERTIRSAYEVVCTF